jgi:hypothetical protein
VFKQTRIAEDRSEEELLNQGWEFVGVSLFSHPSFKHRAHCKADAIKITTGWLQQQLVNLNDPVH